MKIINFVTFTIAPISNEFENHYVLGETTVECFKTFGDLFVDFKLKNLVDIIEIPEELFENIQIEDLFSPKSLTFAQCIILNNESRLLANEISFTNSYTLKSKYFWKKDAGALTETCPILSKNTKVGSANCAVCKNCMYYDYDDHYIVCNKLNNLKKTEELKLYQK
jgi:hypothetical protein